MEVADGVVEVIRVVVVSPGDVAAERDTVELVVDGLNRRVAPAHGCRLSLWRWESDARPGLHLAGPQGLIDERMEIQDADIVIGIFWKRFGTPTIDAESGSEHELRRAWKAWRQQGRPDVMVYFCDREALPATSDDAEQWHRVLRFREQLPEHQLWWRYTTTAEFERLVREHLTDVVLRRTNDHSAAARAPARRPSEARIRFRLPLVGTVFVGRTDELQAVEEALAVANRAVVTQSITGLGGVGKSRLAAHYVEAHCDEYDVVAWIRAEDSGIADLAELSQELGECGEALSPADRANVALEWLTTTDRSWLLVLDNVESPAQLDACLPRAGRGRVLVTSRDRAVRQFAPALALDVFDPATAIRYLTERAERPLDRAGAERVARALGYLPLALSHAAAYCATGTSFDDYLDLLESLPAEEVFDSNPEVSYAKTVASTWIASIQAAGDDAPLAVDVLAIASHLAPDAIPKSLFAGLVDKTTPLDQKRLRDAFNALARLSLATVDDKTLSVHRLLQKVVRDDARNRDDRRPLKRAVAALVDEFPNDAFDPAQWPLSQRLLPHVVAVSDAAMEIRDAGERIVDLLNRACRYLIRADGGPSALAFAQDAAEKANALVGREHPDTLSARHNLASAYQTAGQVHAAIAIYEPLLGERESTLGQEHPDSLTTLHNLASAYRAAGRVDEAIAIYESLVVTSERTLGREHPGTLASLQNLAFAYRAAGRVDEAIAIYEHLLGQIKRVRGREHPSTLTVLQNLAFAYRAAGRVDEAIAIYEPLLAECERILGPEHPETLTTHHNLASAHHAAGRVQHAIGRYEPLLAKRERVRGPEHPDTLATRHNLAAAYHTSGRVEEAIAIYEPLLAQRERILGREHPDTLSTRHNLALAYQDAGGVD